ncbi:hypothetical protein LTS08_007388 [Lithohypha guttulata]|uniref:NAD(P)-binding domain-containing protein n=1 Tax=Lithohypha guttulata TaxID=1690604 RepID=A0AAN7T707_9EURO|nr:hypothetical protein LTR05_000220 [Lithohypha guttulata]KAK5096898.1 hypothetical protein LTS08_007388 [Lithohypha guttulata]
MSDTICFFGATGGTTNASLTLTLTSQSHRAIALVRNPDKLRQQLISQQKVDESLIDKKLTIVQGNALDVEDVKRALLANIVAGKDDRLPFMLKSGLGGAPALQFDIYHPLHIITLNNPILCESAAKTLVCALSELYAEQPGLAQNKPAVTFVSTTGVSRGAEDVPLAMRFLYHQLLAVPHADKRKMEDTFRDNMLEDAPVFKSVTGIRPTLLSGAGIIAEGKGLETVRAGTECKPETGYTISRADVGSWVFENVIRTQGKGRWIGEMVSLTS